MSEFFKAPCGHLVSQLFLLSFLVSQLFSQLLSTASDGHNVKLLPLIVSDYPPPTRERLFALDKLQLGSKRQPLSDVFQGTTR